LSGSVIRMDPFTGSGFATWYRGTSRIRNSPPPLGGDSPPPMYGVWCRMQGVGCGVWGVGYRVPGVGCRVQDVGCRVPGAGCRV